MANVTRATVIATRYLGMLAETGAAWATVPGDSPADIARAVARAKRLVRAAEVALEASRALLADQQRVQHALHC